MKFDWETLADAVFMDIENWEVHQARKTHPTFVEKHLDELESLYKILRRLQCGELIVCDGINVRATEAPDFLVPGLCADGGIPLYAAARLK